MAEFSHLYRTCNDLQRSSCSGGDRRKFPRLQAVAWAVSATLRTQRQIRKKINWRSKGIKISEGKDGVIYSYCTFSNLISGQIRWQIQSRRAIKTVHAADPHLHILWSPNTRLIHENGRYSKYAESGSVS